MGERDWAAEARERWPGCDATLYTSDGALAVRMGGVQRTAVRAGDGYHTGGRGFGPTPIAAIEAAIRAEQDEARATLARLAVWGVDQPDAGSSEVCDG